MGQLYFKGEKPTTCFNLIENSRHPFLGFNNDIDWNMQSKPFLGEYTTSHYYKFTISTRSHVTIEMFGIDHFDTHLVLYKGNGDFYTQNDDRLDDNTDSKMERWFLPADTYYIEVSGRDPKRTSTGSIPARRYGLLVPYHQYKDGLKIA